MAGEIQLNSTTFATESGGTVTIANVDSATNRQNLGLEIGVDVQQFDSDTTKNDVANTFTANQIISVTDNTNAALRVTQLGTGNALVVEDSTNPDSTPFVVNNTGKVGIGLSNPNGALTVKGAVGSSPNLGDAVQAGAAGGYASIEMSGSTGGLIDFNAGDGTDFKGRIFYDINNDVLDFQVNSALRMRMDSNGHILLNGKTSADNTSQTGAVFYSNGSNGTTVNSSSSGFYTFHLYNQNATFNGYRFYVGVNGGIANYQANDSNLSDERLKTNIQLSENYLSKICAIPVKRFNYKDEPEGKPSSLGIIAQDVETVAPELICLDGFEGMDFDGDPVKTVYTTDMMYALMKSIQEQQALIESQQSQIDVLTARIEALETA